MICTNLPNKLALVLGAVIVQTASAQSGQIDAPKIACPLELSANAVTVSAPPLGWVPAVRAALRLSSAEPMVGPPSERGFLKPSFSKSTKNGGIDKWTELDGAVEGGKWIACSYGGNREVILARQIDDKIKECTVEYRRETGGVFVVTIDCKE
jgi:hypothetical protein